MDTAIDLPNVRNITVSSRIGCGATTLATNLSKTLHWGMLNGGGLFREITKKLGLSITQQNQRPDSYDLQYEDQVKKILREDKNHIIQSHLAGFDAQGIDGVFRILLVCDDENGNDQLEERINRLVNRDHITFESAKLEVNRRETEHLTKFRRLYMPGDPNWVYWEKKYYDIVINTFNHNQDETLNTALNAIGFKKNS